MPLLRNDGVVVEMCLHSLIQAVMPLMLYLSSYYGGLLSNRITAIAGEDDSQVKIFALGVVKNFLDMDTNV